MANSSETTRVGYLRIIRELMDGPKTATVLHELAGLSLDSVCGFLVIAERMGLVHATHRSNALSKRRITVWHWCPMPGKVPETAKP